MAYFTGVNLDQQDQSQYQPQSAPYIPQASVSAPMGAGQSQGFGGGGVSQQMRQQAGQGGTTNNLSNAPESVFNSINANDMGFGDNTLAGNAYDRGASSLYNNFERQYGQGATPFALKSQAEGGAGRNPGQIDLFNPYQSNTSQDNWMFGIGPNSGLGQQLGYNGGKFYNNNLSRNAYSGEIGNAYGSGNLPGGQGQSTLFDPISGIDPLLRTQTGGFGGVGAQGQRRYDQYFNDNYLNSILSQVGNTPLGANSTQGVYGMPDLNTFRRDFIYNSQPIQLSSGPGYQGTINPATGRNYTNQTTTDWALSAMNYLPPSEIRQYLSSRGVTPWF